jgi:hypothetical protein
MREEFVFCEKQRLKPYIVIAIIIAVDIMFFYNTIRQIKYGIIWGNNPMSNTGLLIMCIFLLLLTVWLLSFSMSTYMDKEGIRIKVMIFPFFSVYQFFSWDMISKAYVRKYNPIMEYGGWGIKIGGFPFKLFKPTGSFVGNFKNRNKNIAYNISGNKGLQLELTDEKRILIGTRKPFEMEDILRKLGKWDKENS